MKVITLGFLILNSLLSLNTNAGETKSCTLFFRGPYLSHAQDRAIELGYPVATREADADYVFEQSYYSVEKTSLFHFNRPGARHYDAVKLKDKSGEVIAQRVVSSCWAEAGMGCQTLYFSFRDQLDDYRSQAFKLTSFLNCN